MSKKLFKKGLASVLLLTCLLVQAQDEDYFNKILQGKLVKTDKVAKEIHFDTSPYVYHLDLTGNGTKEVLIPSKKDGSDWITIKDQEGKTLFSNKLQAYGIDSHLYKIRVVEIKKDIRVLLLFFMDGVTNWLQYQRTTRVYFLTWTKGQFSYDLYKAAHIAVEKDKIKRQYWRRKLLVELIDSQSKDQKDILFSYGHTQHVFKLLENGEWARF